MSFTFTSSFDLDEHVSLDKPPRQRALNFQNSAIQLRTMIVTKEKLCALSFAIRYVRFLKK